MKRITSYKRHKKYKIDENTTYEYRGETDTAAESYFRKCTIVYNRPHGEKLKISFYEEMMNGALPAFSVRATLSTPTKIHNILQRISEKMKTKNSLSYTPKINEDVLFDAGIIGSFSGFFDRDSYFGRNPQHPYYTFEGKHRYIADIAPTDITKMEKIIEKARTDIIKAEEALYKLEKEKELKIKKKEEEKIKTDKMKSEKKWERADSAIIQKASKIIKGLDI